MVKFCFHCYILSALNKEVKGCMVVVLDFDSELFGKSVTKNLERKLRPLQPNCKHL